MLVTRDGTNLHVETAGPADAKVTVIFAHGVGDTCRTWALQRAALADEPVRQVYYDHRAFGRSERGPRRPASIARLAEDLADVIDATAPRGRIVLVGHSMGALTIQALGAVRPELFGTRVTGVVLAGTPGRGQHITLALPAPLARPMQRHSPDMVRRIRRLGLRGAAGAVPYRIMTNRFVAPGTDKAYRRELGRTIAANSLWVLAAYLEAVFDYDDPDSLEVIGRARTVVVVGGLDRSTPPVGGRYVAAAIPGSRLVELPDSGHMMHAERSEKFNAALLELITHVQAKRERGAMRQST
jgi:pimeloyl-ACP methyl ester carboxylesterase